MTTTGLANTLALLNVAELSLRATGHVPNPTSSSSPGVMPTNAARSKTSDVTELSLPNLAANSRKNLVKIMQEDRKWSKRTETGQQRCAVHDLICPHQPLCYRGPRHRRDGTCYLRSTAFVH